MAQWPIGPMAQLAAACLYAQEGSCIAATSRDPALRSLQDMSLMLALDNTATANATAAFKRLDDAHRVLSDPVQQLAYDQHLSEKRVEQGPGCGQDSETCCGRLSWGLTSASETAP